MHPALRTPICIRRLGCADYASTWQQMRAFTAQRTPDTPDALWVVEHLPVFTLGLAGKRAHLLNPGAIPIVQTDRGGQVTYHGPGQVVVYTLIDLRRLGIYVKELVYRIEQAVMQTLDSAGVTGLRVKGAPGIYVSWPEVKPSLTPSPSPGGRGEREEFRGLAKIAALGVKITNGCAYHGVALNVAMDLEPFARINPCGYQGLQTIDLATLGASLSWETAAERLSGRLADLLS